VTSQTDAGMPARAGAVVALEHVTKRYGPPGSPDAVSDLSLTVPAGEICVLVGPSGCGKTTTMKMVNRLVEPTAGRILLDGDDVTRIDPVDLRRRIGYVAQASGVDKYATGRENLTLQAHLERVPANEMLERIPRLLEWVGLTEAADRLVHSCTTSVACPSAGPSTAVPRRPREGRPADRTLDP